MTEHRRVGPERYRIVVAGHLDEAWSEWFAGLTITPAADGETVLAGPIADQAALHGVLIRIRDLGLPLLALTRVAPDAVRSAPVPFRSRRPKSAAASVTAIQA